MDGYMLVAASLLLVPSFLVGNVRICGNVYKARMGCSHVGLRCDLLSVTSADESSFQAGQNSLIQFSPSLGEAHHTVLDTRLAFDGLVVSLIGQLRRTTMRTNRR